MNKILVTGGAGFVGSFMCRSFKQKYPKAKVVAFDNLKRRGSEINLGVLKSIGVEFVHGDIRVSSDFEALGSGYDVFVEASAEPSVHSGQDGGVDYVIDTNLFGTKNCMEFARRHAAQMIFLSTSRVYSMQPMQEIAMTQGETRFEVGDLQTIPGVSSRGLAENFPTHLPRSFYGMTKLASEQLLQEYAFSFDYPVIINRCGVIAGPGQFGKVDQGVFTLWVARHLFGQPLKYTGFGGQGHQVRDLIHPADLFSLVEMQIAALALKKFTSEIFNVGGGLAGSVSMQELTRLCEEAAGQKISIASDPVTARVDVPWYVSDTQKVSEAFPEWKAVRTPKAIVQDIAAWILANETQLKPLFV